MYTDKKKSFNNGGNNKMNKPAKPKPITMKLPLVMDGELPNGRSYEVSSLHDLLVDLNSFEAFSKLSILATLPKKIAFNNESLRGTIGVAKVDGYDPAKCTIDLTFFGKNLDFAPMITDKMVINANVRTDREGMVTTIVSFDIVEG